MDWAAEWVYVVFMEAWVPKTWAPDHNQEQTPGMAQKLEEKGKEIKGMYSL